MSSVFCIQGSGVPPFGRGAGVPVSPGLPPAGHEQAGNAGRRCPSSVAGRIVLLAVSAVLVAAFPALAGPPEEQPEAAHITCPSRSVDSMAELWGVEVVGLRLSAVDTILDFRYRVVNPEKAAMLLDRRLDPEIHHHASGMTLSVPVPGKIGPLRQTEKFGPPKEGRVYFVLFSNPGRLVQRGDEATVMIGDFRVDIQVE